MNRFNVKYNFSKSRVHTNMVLIICNNIFDSLQDKSTNRMNKSNNIYFQKVIEQ